MIVHEGYSTATGHYFSIVRNEASGKWCKYDDHQVTEADSLEDLKGKTEHAYILFFKKFYKETALRPADMNKRRVDY